YTIEVSNTGVLPAARVEVRAFLPPELRPLLADGPTRWTIKGQTVTFVAVETLPPGGRLTFTVDAEALKAGAARFRAEVRSPVQPQPLVQEEATKITAPP